MATLLLIKEHMKNFYSKFEVYIVPALKFLAALIALVMINSKLGYMGQLRSMPIVLIAALLCSFLPANFIVIISAAFALGHIYKLSIECAAVVFVVFLIIFLLYVRFAGKDTVAVVLTPMLFGMKIPAVMPIAMGLVGTPASMVAVGCGVIVHYVLSFISKNAGTIQNLEADGKMEKFKYLIDAIIGNKEMLVTIVAFALAILVVYVIRRMPIYFNWTIAMVAGALVNIIVLMVGDLKYNTHISIGGTILGNIAAILINTVLQFFVYNVDFKRTEHVQYEDDEYYYYVKAVPKMSVSIPDKTVTRIDTQKPVNRGMRANATHHMNGVQGGMDVNMNPVQELGGNAANESGISRLQAGNMQQQMPTRGQQSAKSARGQQSQMPTRAQQSQMSARTSQRGQGAANGASTRSGIATRPEMQHGNAQVSGMSRLQSATSKSEDTTIPLKKD